MLIEHLPRESATKQALLGERGRWGEVEHLLATIIDRQTTQLTSFAKAHSKKGARVPAPKPIQRPGMIDPDRPLGTASMSIEEAQAWKRERRKEVAGGS